MYLLGEDEQKGTFLFILANSLNFLDFPICEIIININKVLFISLLEGYDYFFVHVYGAG